MVVDPSLEFGKLPGVIEIIVAEVHCREKPPLLIPSVQSQIGGAGGLASGKGAELADTGHVDHGRSHGMLGKECGCPALVPGIVSELHQQGKSPEGLGHTPQMVAGRAGIGEGVGELHKKPSQPVAPRQLGEHPLVERASVLFISRSCVNFRWSLTTNWKSPSTADAQSRAADAPRLSSQNVGRTSTALKKCA